MSMPPPQGPPPGSPPPQGPPSGWQPGPPPQGPPPQGPPYGGPPQGPRGGPPYGQPGWGPPPGGPRKSNGSLVAVILIVAFVVVAGLGVGGYALWRNLSGSGSSPSSAAPTNAATDGQTAAPSTGAPKGVALGPEGSGQPGLGNGIGEGTNPQATKVVELYEDYFCPHCQALETEVGDLLRAQANAGAIRIVRYPLTFVAGDKSKRAALALACASDQDTSGKGEVASKVSRQLFESIEARQADAVSDAAMEELSEQVPDPDEFRSCVQSQKFSTWVGSVGEAASKRNVSATPMVFVNGEEVKAVEGRWLQPIQAALR